MHERRNRGISLVVLILIIAIIAVCAVIVVPYILSIPSEKNLSLNQSNARQARTLASNRYHEDVADGNVSYINNDEGEMVLDGYYWYDSEQRKVVHRSRTAGSASLPEDIGTWEADTLDVTLKDEHYTLGSDVYRYWVVTFNQKGEPQIQVSFNKGNTYTQEGY